jgi:hypothetical protein
VLRKPAASHDRSAHPPYSSNLAVYHGLDTDAGKTICKRETTSMFKADKLKYSKHTIPKIIFLDYEDSRVPDFYSDEGIPTDLRPA